MYAIPRKAFFVLAVLVAVGIGLVAGFGKMSGASAQTPPNQQHGTASCNTNASGFCSITFPTALAEMPNSVSVELVSPNAGQSNLPYQHAVTSVSANGISIRWLTTTGNIYVGTVRFYYDALTSAI